MLILQTWANDKISDFQKYVTFNLICKISDFQKYVSLSELDFLSDLNKNMIKQIPWCRNQERSQCHTNKIQCGTVFLVMWTFDSKRRDKLKSKDFFNQTWRIQPSYGITLHSSSLYLGHTYTTNLLKNQHGTY